MPKTLTGNHIRSIVHGVGEKVWVDATLDFES